jgi:NAD(P)-dependent dehydrogenase (short-subunit alcohol dehydrogenase family)
MRNPLKILVVGGSSGIGLATAEHFAKQHHHVTIVSRTAANQKHPHFCTVNLDFLDKIAVNTFFEVYPDFDYVIVTATTPLAMGPFLSIDLDEAKKSFDRFWGMTHVIHAAAKHSKALKGITVISGAAADKRGAPISFLAANATAVNTLVESLSIELAPIRINAISPGLTDTPLYGETPRETLQEWANATPLKRLASAAEIAEVIYFVSLHPQMTGAIIPVDAGARLA